MKINKTSRTAQYMALFRALETLRKADDRLFSDRYSIYFLDIGLRLAVYAAVVPVFKKCTIKIIQQKGPGSFSSGVARTKYIDDLLQMTIIDGVKQVMILGAGFDTRASRLDFLKGSPVIEIDHPNTSNFKRHILKKHIGKLSRHITYCQADFNKQSLDELSDQYKFDFTKPTTVIWEGVTNYLTKEAINKTFLFVSKFPKGSYIIFTYVHKQVIDDPASFIGAEKLLKDLEKLEEHWTFGFLPEELPGYLIKFGLTLIEDMGAEMYRAKYLPHRSEKGYEFYRVAIAKK